MLLYHALFTGARIRLQERTRTRDTEEVRAFALLLTFFGVSLRRTTPETTLEASNHEKTLTVHETHLDSENVQL